jgi:hypothetical protein
MPAERPNNEASGDGRCMLCLYEHISAATDMNATIQDIVTGHGLHGACCKDKLIGGKPPGIK